MNQHSLTVGEDEPTILHSGENKPTIPHNGGRWAIHPSQWGKMKQSSLTLGSDLPPMWGMVGSSSPNVRDGIIIVISSLVYLPPLWGMDGSSSPIVKDGVFMSIPPNCEGLCVSSPPTVRDSWFIFPHCEGWCVISPPTVRECWFICPHGEGWFVLWYFSKGTHVIILMH